MRLFQGRNVALRPPLVMGKEPFVQQAVGGDDNAFVAFALAIDEPVEHAEADIVRE
jgi:hypothetical protein